MVRNAGNGILFVRLADTSVLHGFPLQRHKYAKLCAVFVVP